MQKFSDYTVKIPGVKMAREATVELMIKANKLYKRLTNVRELSHGKGIGVTAEAYAAGGAIAHAEIVVHNGKMALFCAPGVGVKSDIGVGASISGIKTLGCGTNRDYRGKFLTFEFGVSGELIGLPASLGMSYSIGLDFSALVEELHKSKANGDFYPSDLVKEIRTMETLSVLEKNELFGNESTRLGGILVMRFLSSLIKDDKMSTYFNKELGPAFKEYWNKADIEEKPLTISIKEFIKQFQQLEKTESLTQTRYFLNTLDKNLSACDAITAGVGFSLSLSPINLGTQLFHYKEMAEFDISELKKFSALAPYQLAKMAFSKAQRQKYIELIEQLNKIPSLDPLDCSVEGAGMLANDLHHLNHVLSP
jgi:hypothetical protein